MEPSSFDIRRILSFPCFYTLYQHLIGDKKLRHIYVNNYIQPKPGDKIIDIGCGPGEILNHLPGVEYIGFDENERYIHGAQKKFREKATFLCKRITADTINEGPLKGHWFDIALSNGILHHLNDQEALSLFDLAHKLLKPGGRLFTLDLCYAEKEPWVVRWLVSIDRGKYTRTEKEYLKLASRSFGDIKSYIRNDLYRIPFTIIILACKK